MSTANWTKATVHNGGLTTLAQCVVEVREQLEARWDRSPNPGCARSQTGDPNQPRKREN
jgi:hypothetical protein